MKKHKDPNYIVKVEKAISKKYGEDTIQNPRGNWNEEKEHKALLILIDEFEAEECYIRKCIWFSTSNYHYRKQEEAKGAFYQSGFCKESCVPRRFLK